MWRISGTWAVETEAAKSGFAGVFVKDLIMLRSERSADNTPHASCPGAG